MVSTEPVDAFLNLLPGTLGEDREIVAALDNLIHAERQEAHMRGMDQANGLNEAKARDLLAAIDRAVPDFLRDELPGLLAEALLAGFKDDIYWAVESVSSKREIPRISAEVAAKVRELHSERK